MRFFIALLLIALLFGCPAKHAPQKKTTQLSFSLLEGDSQGAGASFIRLKSVSQQAEYDSGECIVSDSSAELEVSSGSSAQVVTLKEGAWFQNENVSLFVRSISQSALPAVVSNCSFSNSVALVSVSPKQTSFQVSKNSDQDFGVFTLEVNDLRFDSSPDSASETSYSLEKGRFVELAGGKLYLENVSADFPSVGVQNTLSLTRSSKKEVGPNSSTLTVVAFSQSVRAGSSSDCSDWISRVELKLEKQSGDGYEDSWEETALIEEGGFHNFADGTFIKVEKISGDRTTVGQNACVLEKQVADLFVSNWKACSPLNAVANLVFVSSTQRVPVTLRQGQFFSEGSQRARVTNISFDSGLNNESECDVFNQWVTLAVPKEGVCSTENESVSITLSKNQTLTLKKTDSLQIGNSTLLFSGITPGPACTPSDSKAVFDLSGLAQSLTLREGDSFSQNDLVLKVASLNPEVATNPGDGSCKKKIGRATLEAYNQSFTLSEGQETQIGEYEVLLEEISVSLIPGKLGCVISDERVSADANFTVYYYQ